MLAGVALATCAAENGDSTIEPLDPEVADLAAMSPFMRQELARLREDGWRIGYRDLTGTGAGGLTEYGTKTVVIDKNIQKDPKWATAVLAHEVGHAYAPDEFDSEVDAPKPGEKYASWLARNMYGPLSGEAEAGLVSAQARKEILDNGGPDIGNISKPVIAAYEHLVDGEKTRDEMRHDLVKYHLSQSDYSSYVAPLKDIWNDTYAETHGPAKGTFGPDDY
ncbi:hypothetical protein [Nocardia carnea]|uniref:hypothetical protein n=1 Tax=Nocardia carnea TaxID=37328 RepID=UPI0024568602|nr:hypothetical protein [Nocardia carnea]